MDEGVSMHGQRKGELEALGQICTNPKGRE